MITLYGFGPGFGLPEISPFVTKTEVQLKMAGLAYRKEKAMPPASPKGQLPYIVDEAESIADSTFIRAHIEGKYGFDFDAPLNLQQRAQAWAFERMIEHHVYWALVGARWVDAENFAKGRRISSMRRPSTCVKTSRRRAIPCRRELPAERSRPPRPGRGCRSRGPLVVCAVGPAWGQALFDGRHALRHRCHRIRRACRNSDAVLRLATARAGRAFPKSDGLCRSDDASILSGLCLGTAAAGGLSLNVPAPARLSTPPAPPQVPRSLHRVRPAPPPHRRRRTLRDVLRAVGVPRGNLEQDHLFGRAL